MGNQLNMKFTSITTFLLMILVFTYCSRSIDASNNTDHTNNVHTHMHESREITNANSIPSINIEVVKDPKSGWNLFVELDNFQFNGKNASKSHVDGEGHAHLYINGKKITRLYSTEYFLGELDSGPNTIRVELSSNDHSVLMFEGNVIDSMVLIDVNVNNEE